jgi:hypothetical protein
VTMEYLVMEEFVQEKTVWNKLGIEEVSLA